MQRTRTLFAVALLASVGLLVWAAEVSLFASFAAGNLLAAVVLVGGYVVSGPRREPSGEPGRSRARARRFFVGAAVMMVALDVLLVWKLGDRRPTPRGGWCAAAARCCRVLHGDRGHCEDFASKREESCRAIYGGQLETAKAMGVTCE